MLRIRRLAHKLLSGESISVAAAGGSISKGWADDDSREPFMKGYYGRFVEWLIGTFTGPGQNVTNLGGPVGAVMSPMYAACTRQLVKPAADLVFVEFVQNDLFRPDSKPLEHDPRRLAYERLLRNLLMYPGRPAVVAFMSFPHIDAFWPTAENDHLVIAAYYGVPVISTRAAFYPNMLRKEPGFRLDGTWNGQRDTDSQAFFFARDNVHPWSRSYQFMAEPVIHLFQQAALSVAMDPLRDEEVARVADLADVPPPMFRGNEASESNMCMINYQLRDAMVPGSSSRFEWWDEGRQKWGWWTNATDPGAAITLAVNTTAAGSPVAAAAPSGAPGATQPEVLVVFGCMHSGTKPMGTAEVACVAGCACEAIRINARWTMQVSLVHLSAIRVSQHASCHLRFTMLPLEPDAPPEAGFGFKISVVMVFDYVNARRMRAPKDLLGDSSSMTAVERGNKLAGMPADADGRLTPAPGG